jgi:hypothetical protein
LGLKKNPIVVPLNLPSPLNPQITEHSEKKELIQAKIIIMFKNFSKSLSFSNNLFANL